VLRALVSRLNPKQKSANVRENLSEFIKNCITK
jgi:hypothetical protein